MKYEKRKLFYLNWDFRNNDNVDDENNYVLDSIMIFDVEQNINDDDFDWNTSKQMIDSIESGFNELKQKDQFIYTSWDCETFVVFFKYTKTRMDIMTRMLNHALKPYKYKVNKNTL